MSTILIGKHSIEECIHKTNIPDLDFISSGPVPPNPSELILRPEMDAFIEELQKLYQVILIDTPPVGMVTDGTLLMRKADLPIYVVRAEYSKKGFEKNINELYKKYKYHNLSVILNGFRTIKGYGYGYKYGYYGKSYGYYEKEKLETQPFYKKLFNFKKTSSS
jgi:capsular exopolysaccharide synthesis family protein